MSPSAPRPDESRLSPRLQKVLALAGLGSRRQCEELILDCRVEIDRKVVSQLGTRVDPQTQEIRVDGEVLRLPRFKYFMLHKPAGVVSTARDPWARTRVIDLVDDASRLFTVGRLDKSSTGLILLTNDGELAERLSHPRHGVQKTYKVVVAGQPDRDAMQRLKQGIYLAEGKAQVDHIRQRQSSPRKTTLEIVLSEGRNREIRRILARVGHKVLELKRIAIGPLRLGELPLGAYRELTRDEVRALRRDSQAGRGPGAKTRPPRRGKSAPPPVATNLTEGRGSARRPVRKKATRVSKSTDRRQRSSRRHG